MTTPDGKDPIAGTMIFNNSEQTLWFYTKDGWKNITHRQEPKPNPIDIMVYNHNIKYITNIFHSSLILLK